jgi:phage terminase large subunit-like protein
MTTLPTLSPDLIESLSDIHSIFTEWRKAQTIRYRPLDYSPYPKQSEFHAAGLAHRERLFLAGNQLGKTLSGAFEEAVHATGKYPKWWTGRRFDGPTNSWVAGVTGESTRDTVQRALMGRNHWGGGGALRQDDIAGKTLARGAAGLLDTIRVRHVTGGISTIGLKSYEKGREKWQGETLHRVWFDEEPPLDIYSEGLTRTNATGGLVVLTMTPLLGMTELMRVFLQSGSQDRHVTTMTIDDAGHYTDEERARIVAAYPEHEREARARGVPALGSGRIFPIADAAIAVDAFEIPRHWPLLGGIDFGWDHPTAAVRLALDRDADCVYVTHAYRLREATPVLHAASLKAWGERLQFAWPHDGLQHSKDSGEQLAEQYRRQGLAMLRERATFADGTAGVEAGIFEMLDRMQTGRWKVFRHLEDWFAEFRLYHREEGRVVKLGDDLISASRYALMMLRHARPTQDDAWSKPIKYGPSGIV